MAWDCDGEAGGRVRVEGEEKEEEEGLGRGGRIWMGAYVGSGGWGGVGMMVSFWGRSVGGDGRGELTRAGVFGEDGGEI